MVKKLVEKTLRVFFFFFSSRRRHTRLVSDWSSDVCSSDLPSQPREREHHESHLEPHHAGPDGPQVRSEERRVGKGVDLGGRRIIKKKKKRIESCCNKRRKVGMIPIHSTSYIELAAWICKLS